MSTSRPIVLCISGHDPVGGAGIQADIEAISALGGHALTLVSCLTVQDSRNVARVQAVDLALLREQAEVLLADARVDAIKIGLVGEARQVPWLRELIERTRLPAVLDPVLRAGGGTELAAQDLVDAIRQDLVPAAEVLTPNAAEARRLAPAADLDGSGAALLALGARNVLITGGDEPGDPVVNRWYRREGSPRRFAWPRVPGAFHGAGCTLAAAIATLLGRGLGAGEALTDAQAYVDGALRRGFVPGRGRQVPGRRIP